MATDTETYEDAADERITAVSRLPPNLAIMRMEMDAIQSLAAARPRDMAMIKKDLSVTLKEFPELANESIYNKPVGKVQLIDCRCGYQYEATSTRRDDMLCPSCGKIDIKAQRQVQKYARGLSIKAAEALAECYGFNSVKADVEPIDADTVKVIGVFVDYQRGTRREFSSMVSRFYKSRGGGMTRHADDRFSDLVVKSAQSKVVREAITRSVNAGLKAWFFDQCDKIQDGLLDDPAVQKIVGQFATKNVSLEMIESLLGRPKAAGWTVEDRKTLIGVWNALKTGESTVHELFRSDDEPSASSAGKGDVTGDAISEAKTKEGSALFPTGPTDDKRSAKSGSKSKPKTDENTSMSEQTGKAKPKDDPKTDTESEADKRGAEIVAELRRQIPLVANETETRYLAEQIQGHGATGELLADEVSELLEELREHASNLNQE